MISLHLRSNLLYYFCVSPDNIQDGKKKYWCFEKCVSIPDNSTNNMPYNKKTGMTTRYFFCPPDQETDKHIN